MTAEQDAMDRLAAANPVHEVPLSSRALFLERRGAGPDPGRRRRRRLAIRGAAGRLAAAVATGIVVVNRPAPPPPPVPAPALALPRTILTEAAQHAEDAPRRGRFRARHRHHRPGGARRLRGRLRPHPGRLGAECAAGGRAARRGLGGDRRVRVECAAADRRRRGRVRPGRLAGPGRGARRRLPLHPDLAGDREYQGELPGDPAAGRARRRRRIRRAGCSGRARSCSTRSPRWRAAATARRSTGCWPG